VFNTKITVTCPLSRLLLPVCTSALCCLSSPHLTLACPLPRSLLPVHCPAHGGCSSLDICCLSTTHITPVLSVHYPNNCCLSTPLDLCYLSAEQITVVCPLRQLTFDCTLPAHLWLFFLRSLLSIQSQNIFDCPSLLSQINLVACPLIRLLLPVRTPLISAACSLLSSVLSVR
jgi:hypothetical protein